MLLRTPCSAVYPRFCRRSYFLEKSRRKFSDLSALAFEASVKSSETRFQIYVSRNHDPFVNLSIEHFLLQNSPPESTILFLYVNSPCVVIGRNQNPWLETNLRMLRDTPAVVLSNQHQGSEKVRLMRRRSGGGTVFHDYGNVNYSVICPPANFTRDQHAEMVTQAIRYWNSHARVNKRHDIIIDKDGHQGREDFLDPADACINASYSDGTGRFPLKVSGSAYKLTRQRALHHGTCLLASPNLNTISHYLKSPAGPFLKARGVESVRSPVGNICGLRALDVEGLTFEFNTRVIQAFVNMYGIQQDVIEYFSKTGISNIPHRECACGFLGTAMTSIAAINEGVKELKSSKWVYGQTPQFTLSSHVSEENGKKQPPLPTGFPQSARVHLTIRSGVITNSKITTSSDHDIGCLNKEDLNRGLEGKSILEIEKFADILLRVESTERPDEVSAISAWLDDVFGK